RPGGVAGSTRSGGVAGSPRPGVAGAPRPGVAVSSRPPKPPVASRSSLVGRPAAPDLPGASLFGRPAAPDLSVSEVAGSGRKPGDEEVGADVLEPGAAGEGERLGQIRTEC